MLIAAGSCTIHAPMKETVSATRTCSTRVALGTDGWNAAMAEAEGALARLAEQNDDAGIFGGLAGGHRLVDERFGTYPEPLAPCAIDNLCVRKDVAVCQV